MSFTIGMAHAAKPHQALMRDLLIAIHLYSDDFDALSETNIDDRDPRSRIPDITVSNSETDENLFFVEITNKRALSDTLKKVQNLVNDHEIDESFVVQYEKVGTKDYEIIKWYRVTPDGVEEDNSFSEIMDVDLDDLLNEDEE